MEKTAVTEVILMVGFSSMQGCVLFTLPLTQKSSPVGCRTLFFFFQVKRLETWIFIAVKDLRILKRQFLEAG